jgi:putative addiction module CopG family antidote
MTIHLKPELEAMIQSDLERGLYRSADDLVERAIQMLHAQEQWFADDRDEIDAMIEHGFAQAERGELIDGDEVAPLLRALRTAQQNTV